MDPQSVKVIGCGHKQLYSKKTGLHFPAFLIQFSDTSSDNTILRYQWRSKRDFLLLKRSIKKESTTQDFPKNAYSKLCEYACETGPWVIPKLTKALKDGKDDIFANIGISQSSTYSPKLKKSILRLDTFLNNCVASQGWTAFCRNEDSAGIVDPKEISKHQNYQGDDETLRAANLSQYFTSKENAKKVIDEAFKFCSAIEDSSHTTVISDESLEGKEWSPIVFIEPSCGDGKILQELMERLISSGDQLNRSRYCILAFDIDDKIIQKCKENMSQHENVNDASLTIHCCNFLELTFGALSSMVAEATQIAGYVPLNHFQVVLVGNPPYGTAGSRDLPIQFVMHGIVNLKAAFVSFLVPSRCDKDIEMIKESIMDKSQLAFDCETHELKESIFYFQGNTINQPSILQCWRNVSRSQRSHNF